MPESVANERSKGHHACHVLAASRFGCSFCLLGNDFINNIGPCIASPALPLFRCCRRCALSITRTVFGQLHAQHMHHAAQLARLKMLVQLHAGCLYVCVCVFGTDEGIHRTSLAQLLPKKPKISRHTGTGHRQNEGQAGCCSMMPPPSPLPCLTPSPLSSEFRFAVAVVAAGSTREQIRFQL